jgi:hypothetical protein
MIILFLLLTSQSLNADCRWILWERTQIHMYNLKTEKDIPWQPEWNAIEDMQTGTDCARVMDKYIAERAKRLQTGTDSDRKVEIVGSSIVSTTILGGKDGSLLMVTAMKLNCYPGGFDPRPMQER